MINVSNSKPNGRINPAEEESRVRRNLSKLIHKVQHLPSDRYHAHESSLRSLINELASFQAPHMDVSVDSQRDYKKPFSRKYLDLRLYPSPDRSNCPECDERDLVPKLKKPSPTKNTLHKIDKKKRADFKKGKHTDTNPSTIPNNCKESKPPKNLQGKHAKENAYPENDRRKRDLSQAKTRLLPKNTKQKPLQRSNSEEKISPNRTINSEKPQNVRVHIPPSKKTNSLINDKHGKYKVLDKFKGFVSSDIYENNVKLPNMLGMSSLKVVSKETHVGNDQASMVKKLTSYWNNLLKNDIDESSHVEDEIRNVNKSLQDIARSSCYYNRNIKSRNRIISRTRSESSIVVLNNCDGRSGMKFATKQEENSFYSDDQSKMVPKTGKYEAFLRLKPCDIGDVPESTNLFEICKSKRFGEAQHQVVDERDKTEVDKFKFNPKVQDVVGVMEKLVHKLKPFSSLSLTSDQITLSHSLRTMLCLMTATVFSSDEEMFGEVIECRMGLNDVVGEGSSGKDSLFILTSQGGEILQDEPTAARHECQSDISNNREGNDIVVLVPFQGITLRKAEDALRYLNIWKDYVWAEFISKSELNEDDFYSWNQKYTSPQTFTFIVEEEIVFENNCSDKFEENYCEYDTENEDNENSAKDICTDNILDRFLDWVFDMVLLYWPDSVQEVIAIIYQASASLLVFWVVTKEIFGK